MPWLVNAHTLFGMISAVVAPAPAAAAAVPEGMAAEHLPP